MAGVTRLLQFFSMAVLTQVILALSQLILLPIQIRMWGHGGTAAWYSALAIAAITTVVDCGLRTAGHAELLRSVSDAEDPDATSYFRQVWGWIRVLILSITVLLVGGGAVLAAVKGSPYPIWKAALTFAYALETVLIIRIMYLDTLGFYRAAEASYFIFAALRLTLSIPALLMLHVQPGGLAWLFLITSALGVALQGRFCRGVSALGVFARLPGRFSIRTLSVARYTLAEPCANWVRLSLPVLVIAAVAPPAAVTAYAALRAVFGAGRTTIQQLSRVASVEYLRFRADGREAAAESLLCAFVLLAGLFSAAMAGFVVADNMRLLGIWLTKFDRLTFQTIAISFALSAVFYAYQILLSLMFRVGGLAGLAKRQYAYIFYSGAFAAVACKAGSLSVYLGLLIVSEVALSVTFMLLDGIKALPFRTRAGSLGLVEACAGFILVLTLWVAAQENWEGMFASSSFAGALQTTTVFVFGLCCFVLFNYLANRDLFRSLPFLFRRSENSPLINEAVEAYGLNQNV